MASFKESLNKTDKAFGVPIKGASFRLRMKNIGEDIRIHLKNTSVKRMLIPSLIGATLLVSYPAVSYLTSRHSADRMNSISTLRADCEKGNCTIMEYRAALPKESKEMFDELMKGEIKIVKKRNKRSGITNWTNTRRLNERLQNMRISSFKASLDNDKKKELDKTASQEKEKSGSWFILIAFQLNALANFFLSKKGKGAGIFWAASASTNAGQLAANVTGTLGGIVVGAALWLANIGMYVAMKIKEKKESNA